ncbi:probable serine/threonine-protein kinase dyrk2 [Saccostrea echinata]|uniref:probable serine/threonine-protein kinase dyrk2 n=1 Tax=Saccostrea echinata TaxID=191078 RepID=UPI002A815855|nr:probable serine/threonine-protein kinase dyrk2 [Saccostrea echinata]
MTAMHTSSNNGHHTKEPPLFPVIHMDINSLKRLPAFDEPINQVQKRIHEHQNTQHRGNPPQNIQRSASFIQNKNIQIQQNTALHQMVQPASNHIPLAVNIRPPAVMNSASHFMPHNPVVKTQSGPAILQQVNNRVPMISHQVTRVPLANKQPAFHPPMVMTPAMSGKNRVNPSIMIQNPSRPQAQPILNQPINIQSVPLNMNQVPLNTIQGQLPNFPLMGINTIQNQPLLMLQRPVIVNSVPQNVQLIQSPIANGQPLMGPVNVQVPTMQNKPMSLPQLVFTNGILNQIVPKQNPIAATPKPNTLFSRAPIVEKPKQSASIQTQTGSSNTDRKIPQVVVHQSGNSFKAPSILLKNNKVENLNIASKHPAQEIQEPKTKTSIDIKSAMKQNTALTSVNKSLMKMVLDKLKHTTMDMLKGRLNKMISGNTQPSGLSLKTNSIVNTASRLSNSPLQLMGKTPGNLGVLSGFPTSLDPKRVSVSFNPASSQKINAPKATNPPRTIEIVQQNLNRTMPNNMTLEPFTATTHKKNGKMSILLTSKHTGSRPILIEAATGNILVSHVKGPDGNAQFVIQHAREATPSNVSTATSSSTTPAVTEEVEVEAEDIITTSTSTTSSTSTAVPTTVLTGFNSVTTTSIPVGR